MNEYIGLYWQINQDIHVHKERNKVVPNIEIPGKNCMGFHFSYSKNMANFEAFCLIIFQA